MNLHLEVIDRRPDGYHELRTVFQTVDLADEISLWLVEEDGVDLVVDVEALGAEVPAGRANLATRAAEAFRQRWAPDLGVELGLRKAVPVGAGLGGGSSDAAAVLLGLRRLTGRPAERADLEPIARDLGADVPYFLSGGTALGTGRGDEIVRVPELPSRRIWLAVPDLAVSTPEVFGAIGRLDGGGAEPAILAAATEGRLDWELVIHEGRNDLEPVACELHPELGDVRDTLREIGASAVRMSGSGGAILALFAEERQAAEASRRLAPRVRLLAVRTLNRSELEERRFAGA